MDWSLALLSQGIESVIQRDSAGGWELHVATADAPRARATIEQFRRENLRWPWRRKVWHGQILFDGAAVLWVVLTGAFFLAGSPEIQEKGILDAAALAQGQWWRFFTAEVLHSDSLHFASNSVFGLLLLGFALGRYGTGVGLLAAFLAGAAGNVLSWVVHGATHRSLGASGVVMGALGLLAAQSWNSVRGHPQGWRIGLGGLAAGLMLFVLLALTPGSDVAAHLGGFAAGTILGILLALDARLAGRSVVNLLASLLLAALVVVSWLLALRAT